FRKITVAPAGAAKAFGRRLFPLNLAFPGTAMSSIQQLSGIVETVWSRRARPDQASPGETGPPPRPPGPVPLALAHHGIKARAGPRAVPGMGRECQQRRAPVEPAGPAASSRRQPADLSLGNRSLPRSHRADPEALARPT